MPGSCTTTETTYGSVKRIKFEWTSSAGGVVVAAGTTSGVYDGKLIWVATVPDAISAPTDDYDVELRDADAIDLLMGNGADRDTADTEYIAEASIGAVAQSTIVPYILNAGNAKRGTIYVWIR